MHNIRLIAGVLVIGLAPSTYAMVNGGAVPGWMLGMAVAGLLIAAVTFFIPRREDIDA